MNHQELRRELQKLEDSAGRITPALVLEAARSPASPLHACFEWDDAKAAEAFRIDQARELIRKVRVVVVNQDVVIRHVAYVHDPDAAAREQGYRAIDAIRPDRATAYRVLEAEVARAHALMMRARELSTALELSPQVDQILGQLTALRGAARSGTIN
jgi:hypothetical protein